MIKDLFSWWYLKKVQFSMKYIFLFFILFCYYTTHSMESDFKRNLITKAIRRATILAKHSPTQLELVRDQIYQLEVQTNRIDQFLKENYGFDMICEKIK